MSQRSKIETFHLTCSQPRAWLVVNSEKDETQVVEMWNGYSNHWSVSVWLMPGKYRCRYYCGDDKHVVYTGPAHLNGNADDGMDGLVSVDNARGAMTLNATSILLVEDNLATLLATEKLLRKDGYVVHIAEGYQTALDVAKKQRVDLAICDINLWDGNGCDLLRELRELQPIQAIAVTGYTLPDETEHYREAGLAAVLRKPVHHSEISSAIANLTVTSGANLTTAPNCQTD